MDIRRDDYTPDRRRVLELGAALGSFLAITALGGCTDSRNKKLPESSDTPTPNLEIEPGQELDLLTNQAWSMAGVERRDDSSLDVIHTNMKIVKKDGAPGQENPPVNLFGLHLNIEGDFSLTASVDLSDYPGEGAITLYGQPPIIYDELRYETKALRIALQNNSLRIGLVNGEHGQAPIFEQSYPIIPATNTAINIVRQGGYMTFNDIIGRDSAGRYIMNTLGSIPEAGLFDSGQLWLGLDANSPGAWRLKAATVTPLPGGKIEAIDTSQYRPVPKEHDGLDVLAKKKRSDFHVGTAVALSPLVSDPSYAKLVLGGNFGTMTTENAMKFQFIHPQPGQYCFQEADALVAIAEQNGIKVHGHALNFAEANPAWVQDIAKHQPSQLRQVLEEHITTVVAHFDDSVRDWDVVNEPLADYNTTPGQYGLRRSIWYEGLGVEHIEIALRAAHQASPGARLWINEFGLEADDTRFDQMISLVQHLKSRGVPLHGVGLQMHVTATDTVNDGRSIDTEKLRGRITSLEKIGVKARISELDVDDDRQQGIFSEVLQVCISENNCTDVTFWGATDKYSSSGRLNSRGHLALGTGLPWDAQQQPRAAVSRMKQALTAP